MLTEIKPIDHFRELVSAAIRHQKVRTNELAEHYLSTLLADFVTKEKLAAEPLAVRYLKALGAGRELQLRMMRELGDISLFTSGFFSDSLKRKIVDIDYYIALGMASYDYVARSHRDDTGALFSELSAKFGSFVDVLTEVSERSRLTSSRDILRVYERWLRTKSRQAEKLLRQLGIEPQEVTTKPIH